MAAYLYSILVPAGTPFSVSTLTPLLASLDVSLWDDILISLQNPDVTNPVTLVVDRGVSGTKWSTNRRIIDVAQPGDEAHIELHDGLWPFIRVFAQTDSPYPTVNGVTFEVRAGARDRVRSQRTNAKDQSA